MSLYRHSATSWKDGSLHQLAIPMWGREVVFDGVPVATSQAVHSGWLAVDGRGISYAICPLEAHAMFLLVANDGRPDVLMMNPGGSGGLGFAALRPLPVGVEIYFLAGPQIGDDCTVDVRNEQYQQVRTFLAPYSSMGFLQIRGETDVVMTHVGTTREIVPGVMSWYFHEEKGWATGVVDVNPPNGTRGTVGLRTPDGRLLLASLTDGWDGYVNMPPHLAVSGDGQSVYVSIPSGETTSPTPDSIEWIPYEASTLPPPHVEPFERQVPYFSYYAIGKYGDYFEQILHACLCMNAEDVAKANEQGAYVIAGPEHIDKAMKPAMVMIANDYQGAHPLEEQMPAAEAAARRKKCGLLILDEHDWKTFPSNIPKGAILAFKTWRSSNTTKEDVLKKALETTTLCQNKGHRVCWVLGCDDRLTTLTDAMISETIAYLTSIFAELSNVAIVGAFSYGRVGQMSDGTPTGGGKIHPNGWSWIRAGAAASEPVVWSEFALEEEEIPPDPPKPILPEVKFMNVYRYPKATEQPDKTDGMAPYYEGSTRFIGQVVMATRADLAARNGFGILFNGEWWSLNPDGNWEKRPGTMENLRTWETFYKATPGMSAPREKSPGVIKVFLFDDIWFE